MVKYDSNFLAIAELSVASKCLLIIASLLDFAFCLYIQECCFVRDLYSS